MKLCARVIDEDSGRGLELSTTEPGVQFYTGGYLSEKIIGKGGRRYCKYAGFTFETQKFPDSPNFGHFPSARIDPGQTYEHRMLIRFFHAH
jgi:aldose 1-epimerase